MKEESLLLLSDLQKLINQVVLIDYTIIILGGSYMSKKMCKRIFSVILSLGLVMVQSMNVNAAGNEGLSA